MYQNIKCSTYVLMCYNSDKTPSIIKISELSKLPEKSIVSIAGLLIINQRPSTANGVTFLTLEDESGTANIICWENLYYRYRYYIITGNLLKITGYIEKNGPLVNIIAKRIDNLSYLLKEIEKISSELG